MNGVKKMSAYGASNVSQGERGGRARRHVCAHGGKRRLEREKAEGGGENWGAGETWLESFSPPPPHLFLPSSPQDQAAAGFSNL